MAWQAWAKWANDWWAVIFPAVRRRPPPSGVAPAMTAADASRYRDDERVAEFNARDNYVYMNTETGWVRMYVPEPAAISIPFATLPQNLYIRGPRYRVCYDATVTPKQPVVRISFTVRPRKIDRPEKGGTE